MFGRSGATYLTRERDIIAGSGRRRRTRRPFLLSLLTAAVLTLLLVVVLAIRLMPYGTSF